MNQHLEKASSLYTCADAEFDRFLAWHLCHGIVLCTPDYFALAFHCRRDNPKEPVAYMHSDTLFVTMFSGDMVRALESVHDRYEWIAFQRDFQNSPRIRSYRLADFHHQLERHGIKTR